MSDLHELVSYCPDTGSFTALVARGCVRPGDKLGLVATDEGYIQFMIQRKYYKAHRLAVFLMTGEWPEEVDHINGVRHDNRWCNLRSCTRRENRRNLKVYENNTSSCPGVCWHSRLNAWQARIGEGGKRRHLGYFPQKEDAIRARKRAERELFGEFARAV